MINIGNKQSLEEPRIELMRARNAERLSKVHAAATAELRRMTGLKLNIEGKVDEQALNKALSGQSVERRMRLKSMLFELGVISA